MTIVLENETKELIKSIKLADSYLDCEKVIVRNIKKQFTNGNKAHVIEEYCKKLKYCFEEKIISEKDYPISINYGYAAGFLKTLIASVYWYTWILADKI